MNNNHGCCWWVFVIALGIAFGLALFAFCG